MSAFSTWSTQTYDQNENANALRWGTMYNFWFDADAPPVAEGEEPSVKVFELGDKLEKASQRQQQRDQEAAYFEPCNLFRKHEFIL